MGRTRVEKTIAELKEKINIAERYKRKLLNYVEKVKNKCLNREISYYEYEKLLNLKGKTTQEWFDEYNSYIKNCENKIKRLEGKSKIKKILMPFFFLFFFLILISLFFYLRPVIIGFIVKEEVQAYSQTLNLEFLESGNYEWKLENLGQLNSVKLSGLIEENDNTKIKIYLDDLLILDSSKLEIKNIKLSGKTISETPNLQESHSENKEQAPQISSPSQKEPALSENAPSQIPSEISTETGTASVPEEPSQETIQQETIQAPEQEIPSANIPEKIPEKEQQEEIKNTTQLEKIEKVTPLENQTQEPSSTTPAETPKKQLPQEQPTETIKEFTDICEETCDLKNLNLSKSSYILKIEISNAELKNIKLKLSSIKYEIISTKFQIPFLSVPENISAPENITTITAPNITEINITEIINITKIISINETQYPAVIGKPVKWKKSVKLEKPGSVRISLPKEAENITVNKISDSQLISEEIQKQEQAQTSPSQTEPVSSGTEPATSSGTEPAVPSSENISKESDEKIKKLEEKVEKLEQELEGIKKTIQEKNNEKQESSKITGGITGKAVFKIIKKEKQKEKTGFFNFIKSFFAKITATITGRAIITEETQETIDIIIEDNASEYEINYETPAPYSIEEETGRGKKIEIIGLRNVHYENVLAFTELTKEVSENKIKLYHLINESKEPAQFVSYDKNNNSLIDYIEWIVPSLSNETYELIIEISKAEHLDSNRNFISDIYEQVKALDGIWSEQIPANDYVRVTFEQPLTNKNDITIYARINNYSGECYDNETQILILEEVDCLNINENNELINYYVNNKNNIISIIDKRDGSDDNVDGESENKIIIDNEVYNLISEDSEELIYNELYNKKENATENVAPIVKHAYPDYNNYNHNNYKNFSVDNNNFNAEEVTVASISSALSYEHNNSGDNQEVKKCYLKRWKYFYELNGSEKIITLNNKTGEVEWQKPIGYSEFDNSKINNEMYEIKLDDGSEMVVSEKHKVYASLNNFSISLSKKTLINSCFFNLTSLDQIGDLSKYSDNAKSGKSLLCGDNFLASKINSLYSDLGINLTILLINNNKNSYSELDSSEDFIICFFNPLISKNTKSGETNLYPICLNSLAKRNTLDLLKKENKILVSNINNIFYSCSLATLSFTSSENSLAFLSESFDLEAMVSPISNSNSSSISSCKAFSIALLTNLSNSKFFEIDNISLSNSSGNLTHISAMNNLNNNDYKKLSVDDFNLNNGNYVDNNKLDNLMQDIGGKASSKNPKENLNKNLSDFSLQKITDAYENFKNDKEIYFLDSKNQHIKVKSISKFPYSGKIYDVDVPNDIVLIRRENGTAIWSGNSNPSYAEISVFRQDSDEEIARFTNITNENWHKIYLNNLNDNESYDVFDLKVLGNSIEFDYIVDPVLQTTRLRPDSNGTYNSSVFATGWRTIGSGDSWQLTQDNDITTLVSINGTRHVENYTVNIQNLNGNIGDINYVNITLLAKHYGTGGAGETFVIKTKSNSFFNESSAITGVDSIWTNYSIRYANNPADGKAWNVSSVNSLEVGARPNSGYLGTDWTNISEIYVYISYNQSQNLSSCDTLVNANSVYTLTNNVNSSGTCFTINTQNITLDCAGYTINYSQGGAASTYGITTNVFNTTVKNCNIIDGNYSGALTRYGIYYNGINADNGTIYNNTVTTNSSAIVVISGDYNNLTNNFANSSKGIGLYIQLNKGSIIDGNTAYSYGSGATYAILLDKVLNATLNNNIGIFNGTFSAAGGIVLSNTNYTILYNNTGTSTSSYGIYITSGSNNNNLTSNTGTSTSSYGVYLLISNNNILTNQNATGYFTGSRGIAFRNSNNTIIKDCINISGFSGDILYVTDLSINNTFINCSYRTTGNNETVIAGGSLIRKWYYRANATDTNNKPVVANITATNKTGILEFSIWTNANGLTNLTEITDYVNVGGTRNFYSNYTINATNSSYTPSLVSHGFNASLENNYNDVFVFTVDILAPSVILISPANNTVTNLRTQYFIANFTDDIQLKNATLYVWNSSDNIVNQTNRTIKGIQNSTNISVTLPRSDVYRWNYYACDNAAIPNCAWNNTNFTLTIDITAPNVYLLNPLNNTTTDNATVWFGANITDNYNLTNSTLYIWNSTNTLIYNETNASGGVSSIINMSYTLPRVDTYRWNYYACDNFANCSWNKTNWTVIYKSDAVNPSVYLLNPANNSNINTTIIWFSANATNNVNVTNATLYVWNSTGSIVNQTTDRTGIVSYIVNISVILSKTGNYTWNYYACDNASRAPNCAWNNTNFSLSYSSASVDACRNLNEPNTYYTQSANIIQTGNVDCIVVSAQNITYDCAGYSITSAYNVTGVYSNQYNTTIKNCNISMGKGGASAMGVEFGANADNSFIINNTLNNNYYAINFANGVANALIENNTVNYSYNTAFNLGTISSSEIKNNIIINATNSGISITGNGNNITNNNVKCFLGAVPNGISIGAGIYNNTLKNNWANASNDAFVLSSAVTLINNTAYSSSGDGIQTANAGNSVLINNTGISTSNNGINLLGANNSLNGDYGESKGGLYGIAIGASNNTLINVIGKSSTGSGIYLASGFNNTLIGVNASGATGILFWASDDNLIKDCINITGTTNDVSVTTGSTNNTFLNCSYNISKESVAAGNELIRKWYYIANATDTNNKPVVANITATNKTGSQEFFIWTNPTGLTNLTEITDYVNTGGTRSYYSNYTINATNSSYTPSLVSHGFNASLGNNYNDVFVFTAAGAVISWVSEWLMFRQFLNHTAWDGVGYYTIPGLNKTNFTTGGAVDSSPAVANGFVYVGSADGQVYQLNASNISQKIANFTTGAVSFSSPSVANGFVYIGSANGQFYQLNATNVSQLIANYITGINTVDSSPAVSGGYVYIGNDIFYQLNASNISQVVNNNTAVTSISYSSPAVFEGYVYVVAGDNILYQLNASNVSQKISNFITGNQYSSPTVDGDYVYIIGNDKIYQLDASNISINIANFSIGSGYTCSPAVANGYVYACDNSGNIYQLNASNVSKQIANFTAGLSFQSSPAVTSNYVYVGSSDNRIYQLNASNISIQIANFTTGGGVESSPAVTSNYVYVGSSDNRIYQLNATNISLGISQAPSNTAPVITAIYNSSVNGTLNEAPAITSMIVNFSVYDADGAGDLNDSTTIMNFTNSGNSRQNLSCYKYQSSGNYANYTCNVTMWWWDAAGTWNINASIRDNSSNLASNSSATFSIGTTTGFVIGPVALTWNTIAPGMKNQTASNDPILMNNTGNVNITVQINSTNLKGEINNALALWAGNFSVAPFTGGSPSTECNSSATTMNASVFVNISYASLAIGNYTINDNVTGQEQLYFCLRTAGTELITQPYSTSGEGTWTIKIAFIFAYSSQFIKRKRKKRKTKETKLFRKVLTKPIPKIIKEKEPIKNNRLIQAMDLILDELKQEYSLNKKEIIEILVKKEIIGILAEKLRTKYKITKKEIAELISARQEINIPINIFSKKLGALEALTKYLKENLNMNYHGIAKLINRDERTIWTAYNKAKQKQPEAIGIKKAEISLSISIFANRNLTVLESIIVYLKTKAFKYREIANLINRDERNIWTVYSRAVKKIKGKI